MHPKTKPSLSRLATAYIEATDPILAKALTKAPASVRAPIERAKTDLQTELNRLAALPSHRGQRRKQSDFSAQLQVDERTALLRFEAAARRRGTLKETAAELGLSEPTIHAAIESSKALSDLVARLRTEGALLGSRGRR